MLQETSEGDRITEVRIRGMRALADVRLPLGGLTVLIGENGSGKSTLLEGLELIRRAVVPGSFINDQLGPFHGGLDALLRAGESTLRVDVRIDGTAGRIAYGFALTKQWTSAIVSEEHLDVWDEPDAATPRQIIVRDAGACRVLDQQRNELIGWRLDSGQLALPDVRRFQDAATAQLGARVVGALGAGRVHVPFDIRPGWLRASPAPMRLPAKIGVAAELEQLGGNLASCYHALSNSPSRDVWERTMERVRAGLGSDVVNVRTPAVGPAQIELVVDFRGVPLPISALALSDGQLAYLAFVALTELGRSRSFLAFDEPETHLHPELLVRVVWLLEELAESCPVVLSTHSDRLLDALSEPAKSVVLCDLDETRATRLYRPEPEALAKWLARYRGLGELRTQGYAPHVFREPVGKET